MSVKQTSINTTLTPSGEIAFANSALGAVPAPPQDRFSAGSLASSVLSVSPTPMFLLIGAAIVIAADADGANTAGITAAFADMEGVAPSQYALAFAEDSVIGKSGQLDVVGFPLDISVSVQIDGGSVTEPVALALLAPRRPTYSLLSLTNKVESVCKETGKGFIVTLDQSTSRLSVFVFASPSAAAVAVSNARAAFIGGGGEIRAAFDLLVPTTGSSVTKHAFE